MTDLPERLRNAAEAHRPDRERMLARVEHAMAADGAGTGAGEPGARGHDRPAAAPWMRVTAVTAAVAGAIGIGGLAVGAVTGDGQPVKAVVTSDGTDSAQSSPPASGGSPSADHHEPAERQSGSAPAHRKSPSAHPSSGRTATVPPPLQAPPPSGPGSSTQQPTGTPGGGGQAPQSSGPLQSNGVIGADSDNYWTQSNVVLTTRQTLTSLTVELRIARVNGETYTGSWTSVGDAAHVQVTVQSDVIVYRWTLPAGKTIAPGTYTFAGQFQHDQGQGGTDGDSYTATAGYGSGSSATVGGHF
ncbi:hypothetical protein [Actinacidiphila epipremni]|jgi:hypothetical protein|uniref:Uncharacterized protein n=1 Tax=Actinacidiphila epipremni TaxID=2053013 RepID=A0ABX0ZQV8_9ACTN|nr:hypothetical protein [Actinacidiphila epipremni]NJP45636.1 hypothetical protein [Actinacidiphila epipremni]